jgi:hypothetical protein
MANSSEESLHAPNPNFSENPTYICTYMCILEVEICCCIDDEDRKSIEILASL